MTSSRSIELFVPGRVCLLGEHSDWAGTYRRFNSDVVEGYALVSGTRQGLFARVQPHPSKLVVSSVLNDGSTVKFEIAMDPEELLKNAAQGGFWSYCCGVAYEIATNYHVRGLIIENYKTDLPIKKGLSSSAALCVLVTRAFNRVYDLKLNVRGEMDIAYRGEIRTPSRCGRLDQCCAFGQAVVSMSFDADSLGTREVATKEEIFLVLVDLHGQKDTKEILKCLNKCYPFPSTEVEKGVHELLGPLNKQTVLEAMRVLETGVDTAKQLGALMSKAQANFDKLAIPACPHELTAPILHKVLSYGPIQQHIWGGKGVGSQGDGTAQFVAKSKADQLKLMQILEKDLKVSCLELTLGARRIIRKAVIPCAGYGKGMFPASKCVKAPMFPIIDRDGIMKPAILVIVEEALQAGVEEVALVVQPHDLGDFRALFHEPLPPENFNTLSTAHQAYAKKLEEVGRHVKLIPQESQMGFGHAVYCARDFVGSDHFLLLLGDHLYRSKERRSCAKQLIEAYERTGQSVVALQWVPEGLIGEVGVVSGMAHKGSESKEAEQVVLDVTEVAEKPPVDYAREKLRVSLPSAPSGNHYLGVFGQYVLDTQIFALLGEAIERNLHERNGGIGLSLSLERLRKESRLLGLISNGDRFDLGMPQHYLHTLSNFHLPPVSDAR